MPKPWEKQPKEGPSQFAFFQVYRDMGYKRTVAGACEKHLNMKPGDPGFSSKVANAEQYSSRYSWVARAHEYDLHLDAVRVKVVEEDVKKAAELEISTARLMLDHGTRRLLKVNPDTLTLSEAQMLVVRGAELAQKAMALRSALAANARGELVPADISRRPFDDEAEQAILLTDLAALGSGKVLAVYEQIRLIVAAAIPAPLNGGPKEGNGTAPAGGSGNGSHGPEEAAGDAGNGGG